MDADGGGSGVLLREAGCFWLGQQECIVSDSDMLVKQAVYLTFAGARRLAAHLLHWVSEEKHDRDQSGWQPLNMLHVYVSTAQSGGSIYLYSSI